MKQTPKSTATPHNELRIKKLAEPKRADFALKLAMQEFENDGDVDSLLETLRLVAQAQGGISFLARKTSLSRQSLHEALSPTGNPRLRTFQNVIENLGYRMSFKPIRKTRLVS